MTYCDRIPTSPVLRLARLCSCEHIECSICCRLFSETSFKRVHNFQANIASVPSSLCGSDKNMFGPQTLKVVDTTIKQKVMWNTAVDDKLEKQDWKRTTKYKKYIYWILRNMSEMFTHIKHTLLLCYRGWQIWQPPSISLVQHSRYHHVTVKLLWARPFRTK